MDPYVFVYQNKKYLVKFDLMNKIMHKIRFKISDGVIICQAGKNCTRAELIKVIESHKLALSNMFKRNLKETDNYIFIFGEQHSINEKDGLNEIENIGIFKTINEKNNLLKLLLNRYLAQRFYYFEDLMRITHGKYHYCIKNVKTRYGSNSLRTKSIMFSLSLVHYSYAMIDSVIVHEFAHDFQRNHSKKFYDIVYKYCPNYDELHKKMTKGLFK